MTNRIFFDNVLYAEAFLHYLLEHPQDAERIPANAVIMFSPEELDPGFSARNRLVVKTPEAYRGRMVIPVGVRETGDPRQAYEFLFPWTGSDVWVRLDQAQFIQEHLTASRTAQTENATIYFLDRTIHIVPRIQEAPVPV